MSLRQIYFIISQPQSLNKLLQLLPLENEKLTIMMQLFQQSNAEEQEPIQPYLISKDWITLQYKDFILQAEGFSSLELDLKHTYQVCPYYSLFQIKKVKTKEQSIKQALQQGNKKTNKTQDNIIMFGDVVTLQHVLSGKYLSYNYDFNNKSQVKLKSILSSSCQFCIKPIYKCQMTRSKKIRVNQQIIVYPFQTKTSRSENIALVVTEFMKGKQTQLKLELRINQQSHFSMARKNLAIKQKSFITTMNIYQLINIETNKALSYKKQIQRKRQIKTLRQNRAFQTGLNIISTIIKQNTIVVDGKTIKLSFEDCINQYHTFLSFVTEKSGKMIDKGKISEEKIEYGQKVAIRVFQQGYLLSFKSNTDIELTQTLKESCLFLIEQYDLQESNLQESSIIKLRHYQTGLYFSLPSSSIPSIHLQQFGLLNTFLLCNVQYQKLHTSLFVNQNYNVLKVILDKSQNESMEQSDIKILKKTLRDVIEYIYRDKNVYEIFNVMQGSNITQNNQQPLQQQIKQEDILQQKKQSLKFKMSKMQQNLLNNIGFLEIIHILGKKLLNKLKDDKSQRQYQLNKQKNSKKSNRQEYLSQNRKQNQELDDVSDIEQILMYMMMITAGICHDNPSNVKSLLNYLYFYFQCIGQVKCSVQCLYHIFNNKKQIIFIMSSSQYTIKNKSISYLELLIMQLSSKELKNQIKISVIKLLQSLVLINNGHKKQKIIHHQRILINSFSQQQKRGLKNILYTFSSNEYDDMLIKKHFKDEELQLEDFIAKYSRQGEEIILLKQQINFICSLCYGNDFRNLQFFRSTMSEDMILRYLKSSIYPQFKELFMRGLIQIYLNQARNKLHSKSVVIIAPQGLQSENIYQQPSLSNRLMSSSINSKSQYDQQQMNQISKKHPSYSPKLQKIQNLVLEITRKAIKNQLIDRSFYRNIQALRKFLQLQILDQFQVVEFKKILIEFIKKYYNQSFKGGDKKILVKEILKIIIYYERISIQNLNTEFIKILQNLRTNKQHKKDIEFKKPIVEWQKFIQEKVNEQKQENQVEHQLNFISKLIGQSLKHNCQFIFNESGQLFYLLRQKQLLMLQNLKDKIIIDNQQALTFFKKSTIQCELLIKNISQCMMENSLDYNKIAALHRIDQSVIQVNYLFHQNVGNVQVQGWERVNGLAQNIIRETNVLDSCISFISQFMSDIIKDSGQQIIQIQEKEEEKQSKLVSKFDHKPKALFTNLFQLLNKFIKKNHTNFSLVCMYLSQLKSIFSIKDEGQLKFLFNLSRQVNCRQIIGKTVQEFVLNALLQNQKPVPYAVLTISYLIRDQFQQSFVKETVQKISKLFVSEDVFRKVFKISYEKKYKYRWMFTSFQSKLESDAPKNQNWTIYLLLLFHFFQTLIESSSQRVELLSVFRKCITLQMLLQILEYPDIMDGVQNCEGFATVLLKKQTISVMESIYIKQLKDNRAQFQKMLLFIQKINSKLFYFRSLNKQVGDSQQKITLIDEIRNGQTNQIGKILKQYEKYLRQRNSLFSFEKYQNPIYLTMTIFSPFIFKILNILISTPSSKQYDKSQTSQFQISSLLNLSFQRYKEYISKISSKDLYEHKRQYTQAVRMIQELSNKKIGRSLTKKDSKQFNEDESSDEENSQQKFQSIPQIFSNSNVSNLYINIAFATNATEKYIYQSIFSLIYSQYKMHYQAPINLNSTKESINQSFQLFMKLAQNQQNSLQNYFKILQSMIIKQQKGSSLLMGINYSQEHHSIISNIIQKEQTSTTQISAFFSFTNKLFLSYINSQTSMPTSIKQVIFKLNPKMKQIIEKMFDTEIILHSANKIEHQMSIYCNNQKIRCSQTRNLCIQIVLQWMRNALIVTNLQDQESLFWIIQDIIDILRKYTDYIKIFSSKYVTKELNNKIILILQILYQAMSGNNQKVIVYLIQRQIWDDINLILSLNDNLEKNQQELTDTVSQTLSKCLKTQFKKFPKSFLEEVQQNYKITQKTVGKANNILQKSYPLLPMKSFFSQIKHYAIMLVKSFTLEKYSLSYQLFSRIQMKVIDKNMSEILEKHQFLFDEYSISSLYPQMASLSEEDLIIAQNMKIQNGVDLLSIKMFIQDNLGGSQTVQQFYQYKVNVATQQKIGSAVSAITEFLMDFLFLFTSCFRICRKKKQKVLKQMNKQQIFQFFIQKTGRVQIVFEGKIYSWDFLIRPQCKRNKYRQKIFIRSINFISIQLKLQSIIRQAQNIIFYYRNQHNFYRRFHLVKIISFLDKNIAVLKMSSFVLVISCNIFLIINSSQLQEYFSKIDFTDPYMIILLINLFVGFLIVFLYIIKEIPFLVALTESQLSKKFNSVGSTYNKNSVVYVLIIITRVLFQPRTIYYIFYLLMLGLSFYNKLFISLLLLDVMAQTSALKNILLSVWRPKLSILLTIVSFTLVQYFFSIIMFFNFKDYTYGRCATLGSCFGFVFVTTYKAVSGFVGYLFEIQLKDGTVGFQVTIFEIFQDIYVIVIFQIFFALILAIIIDNFTMIRAEETNRKENLNHSCLVCNLDRSIFNTSSKMNFKSHIAISHNIWNYFFFYDYVLKKPELQRNKFQRQIGISKNTQWLPKQYAKGIHQPGEEQTLNLKRIIY